LIPRQKQAVAYCLAMLAAFALLLPLLGAASQRIHLTPSFTMGESFRYHIESQTLTTGTTTTPIANPEAAKQLKQVADLEVRLDVVGVQPAANGTTGAARLRATYEKATAATQTDAYDPAAAALDAQYNNLQGRSVEFTIEADGKISHITGLDEAVSNPSTAAAMRDWITGFSPSANLPRRESPSVRSGQPSGRWKIRRSGICCGARRPVICAMRLARCRASQDRPRRIPLRLRTVPLRLQPLAPRMLPRRRVRSAA
jgi:hypothetical protein